MGFRKIRPQVGARPGTLAIPPDSPPPEIHVVRYDEAGVEQLRIGDPSKLRPLLGSGRCTWIDVRGLGDETVLRELGDVLSLPPLLLEDAVNVPQRAKSEIWPYHHIIIARIPERAQAGGLESPQVCFVLGDGYLVTFQERFFGVFEPVRARLREGIGPIRTSKEDYLCYALLDTIVDGYYPVIEEISHRLDDLEDTVLDAAGADILPEIHGLRRKLIVFRRVGWPMREMLSDLQRQPSAFITEETRAYLRDTLDHASQIMELADASREAATAVGEIHLSELSHRSNEIMKVLTLMASLFIPLTFIAGIYGMNFENMPELQSRNGYFAVLGVMILLAGGMLLYFRRKGWIGGRRRRK
jgi:magnesium transporter